MKKLRILISMMLLAMVATPAWANPDLKELLKNAASKYGSNSSQTQQNETSTSTSSSSTSGLGSAIQGLIQGVLGSSDLQVADLAGTYKYSAPAVAFESENLLQKAGGAAAAGVIENKLSPYYEKAGLSAMTATFQTDSTFVFQLKRGKLQGTFARDPQGTNGEFIFQFKAGFIPIGKMTANVQKLGSKLTITFDASKLITLVNAVAQISGRQSLQTVASVLNSYDGLNCGFELERTADATQSTN